MSRKDRIRGHFALVETLCNSLDDGIIANYAAFFATPWTVASGCAAANHSRTVGRLSGCPSQHLCMYAHIAGVIPPSRGALDAVRQVHP